MAFASLLQQKNAKAVSAKMKNMATDENRVTQQKVAEKTKRIVGNSPKEAPARKRSAFGDITNVNIWMIFILKYNF